MSMTLLGRPLDVNLAVALRIWSGCVGRGGGAFWPEEINRGRNMPDQDPYILPSFDCVCTGLHIACLHGS